MTSDLPSAIKPHFISNSDLDQNTIYNILNSAEKDNINYPISSILKPKPGEVFITSHRDLEACKNNVDSFLWYYSSNYTRCQLKDKLIVQYNYRFKYSSEFSHLFEQQNQDPSPLQPTKQPTKQHTSIFKKTVYYIPTTTKFLSLTHYTSKKPEIDYSQVYI